MVHFIPWQERLRRKLMADIERIISARIIAAAIINKKRDENQMGKLSSLAQRIAEGKLKLEADADVIASDLDDVLTNKAPAAMDNARIVVAGMKNDVAELDSEIREVRRDDDQAEMASAGRRAGVTDVAP